MMSIDDGKVEAAREQLESASAAGKLSSSPIKASDSSSRHEHEAIGWNANLLEDGNL